MHEHRQRARPLDNGPRRRGYRADDRGPHANDQLRAASDDILLDLVRHRDIGAFGELYRRYRHEARRYALLLSSRHLSRDATDDVLAEATRKVLAAIVNGAGPRNGFRPYLFTTIRNVAFSESVRNRSGRDAAAYETVEEAIDGVDQHLDVLVLRRCLKSLPPRWQQVLWLTEATGQPAEQVAEQLGVATASVRVMAMRARDALRVAFIREYLPRPVDERCGQALDLLARRSAGSITERQGRRLDRHLDTCDSCRDAATVLRNEIEGWAAAPVSPRRSLTPTLVPGHRHEARAG